MVLLCRKSIKICPVLPVQTGFLFYPFLFPVLSGFRLTGLNRQEKPRFLIEKPTTQTSLLGFQKPD